MNFYIQYFSFAIILPVILVSFSQNAQKMSTRARNQRVASLANKACGSIFSQTQSQGSQSQGSQSQSILQSRIPTSKGKKRSLTAPVDSNNNQDVWICKICENLYSNETDRLLECNRCTFKFCLPCLPEMDEADYNILSKPNLGCHWYCKECEKDALTAVKTDREIEERCKTFMASFEKRVETVETSLNKKAEKKKVDDLDSQFKESSAKLEGLTKDISTLARKMELSLSEPSEIERRKNNIMIKGIPENDVDDKIKVDEIFEFLKVDKEGIKSVHRVGSKSNKTPAEEGQGTSTQRDHTYTNFADIDSRNYDRENKTRPIRVVLDSQDIKWKVLKAAPTIKKMKDCDFFKSYEVFITPDYTILQRERESSARKKLKAKRELDPNGRWKMGPNFRIVRGLPPTPRDTLQGSLGELH